MIIQENAHQVQAEKMAVVIQAAVILAAVILAVQMRHTKPAVI